MSTLYQYVYSWLSSKPVEEIIHITSTPARNMPNVPKSQLVAFSPADRVAILQARSSLRHITPEPRKSEYPSNSPLLLQLLEATKYRKTD